MRRSNAIRRRLAAITAATRVRVRHREGLRDRAKTARAIRFAALRAKIDPRQIRGLDSLAYTQSELARLGDTPATRCADARFIAQDAELASRQTWEAKIADRVPRFGRMSGPKWGQHYAVGSGAVWLDDCTPNCALGTFHPYAVRVSAFDAQAGHFTHLTLRYTYEGKEVIDRRRIMKVGKNYVW